MDSRKTRRRLAPSEKQREVRGNDRGESHRAGLTAADDALRTALWRAIAVAAGLAALLVGLGVARRFTCPVGRLIEVATAMGRGDRTARVREIRAPGELRDPAAAFDTMADTLARHEQLRRDVVADVAHELRAPVAVLQAGHEALLDQVVEPTALTVVGAGAPFVSGHGRSQYAQRVQIPVGRDLVQAGAHRGTFLKLAEPAPGGQQRFLQRVLGVLD
jgi:signal transduction histidine kinase